MNILKLNEVELAFMIRQAAETINCGGLVLLPFDTVYGFAADPRNDEALLRIFELKERLFEKTIGIALDHTFTAQKLGETKHWKFVEGKVPGPYTFIINAGKKILSRHCYKDDTLAFRIPNSELVYDIILESGGIIAQTSANKSGRPNCFSINDIKEQFSPEELDKIDLIVDGGSIESSRPSEIWDLTASEPRKIER